MVKKKKVEKPTKFPVRLFVYEYIKLSPGGEEKSLICREKLKDCVSCHYLTAPRRLVGEYILMGVRKPEVNVTFNSVMDDATKA